MPNTNIKNLDEPKQPTTEEKAAALTAAFQSADPIEVSQAIVNLVAENQVHFDDMMQKTIIEANRAKEQQLDEVALAQRGVRTLTTEEKKFYNEAIEAESFNDVTKLMPATIFNRVFEDLALEHPLLSKVNFQTTGATTTWIVRKEGATVGYWDDVCAEIQEMLDHGFETINMGMNKFSGFLVVCKAMFELGPEWLDRYVREFLAEVVSAEMEKVIVVGTGNKQPIGMIKDLDGAVVGGVYPDKSPVKLTSFTPRIIGKEILAPATKGGTRRYDGVTLMVNPLDYATTFFPIGVKQKDDGTYTFDNFAIPGLEWIQSPSVPVGTMVSGNPKNYFMGVGSAQEIVSDDSVRLIQDQRLYVVRQLANGKPLDNEAFQVFDITAIKDEVPTP